MQSIKKIIPYLKKQIRSAFFIFTHLHSLKKILHSFSGYYAPDLRALALMRIGTALIVLTDLLIRFTDLEAHYTNAGLWPTELVRNFGWNPGYWSLHVLSGSFTWQLVLFSLQLLFAVFLLLGYKTRLSTLVVWLLLVSLHNRNLFVLQGGDDLLRMLLFWGIFLPWNAHYSIDSRRSKVSQQNTLANMGYLLLVSSVYFFSALLKSAPDWHGDGTAFYYALSLEQLRLPAGDFIYQFPASLKVFTWLAYYIELLVPFLILWPSKKGYLRLTAFLLLLVLHLGIGLTLYVGLFYLINLVATLGLLPAGIMDRIERIFRRKTVSITTGTTNQTPYVHWINTSICSSVIFLCLIVNLSTLQWFPYELRPELSYPVNILRLNQYWGMFSPGVLRKDGWFVYHGMDTIGRQWDMRKNENYVDYTKPLHIVQMYKNDRWRKLAENMQNDHYTFLRPLYGKYILRKWNKEHPEKKLAVLNLYFMEKENLPDYKTTLPVKVLHCVCYAD